jgi:hypothetical protein
MVVEMTDLNSKLTYAADCPYDMRLLAGPPSLSLLVLPVYAFQ